MQTFKHGWRDGIVEIPVSELVPTHNLISGAVLTVYGEEQADSPSDGFVGGFEIDRVLVNDRREVDFSRMPSAFRRKVQRFVRETIGESRRQKYFFD